MSVVSVVSVVSDCRKLKDRHVPSSSAHAVIHSRMEWDLKLRYARSGSIFPLDMLISLNKVPALASEIITAATNTPTTKPTLFGRICGDIATTCENTL
jgi:hypothetical protein